MTLTYNPRLAQVKVDPQAKNQGQTVETGECLQTKTDTYAHGRYQTYYHPSYAVDNKATAPFMLAHRCTNQNKN